MRRAGVIDRIVCSNVHYFYYDTEFFFRSVSEAGARQVEVYLGTPHIFIDHAVIDDFDKGKELAEKYGVKIVSVHPETLSFRYGLCYLDDEWNKKSVRAYRNCIDYASWIGADQLNTNVTGAFRDHDQKEIFKRAASNLKEITAYGREKGIKIAVETESPCYEGFLARLSDAKKLSDFVEDENLLFNINYDGMKAAGETLAQWMDTFPERICGIRFSDLESYEAYQDEQGADIFAGNLLFFPADDCYLEKPQDFDMELLRRAKR